MKLRAIKLLAVAGAITLAATACGSSKKSSTAATDSTAASTTTTMHMAMPDLKSASDLRAGLTSLLQEHVYLAGIATGTALAGADYTAPAATLDNNSIALSQAIGAVYGKAGGDQFLALWRKHIGFFVDYTTGKAKGDAAMVTKARADLDGYRADFGAFLESATNKGLTKQAVADELKGHVESLEAAIDAQAAKSADTTDKLMTAASHMPMTADVLAGAIAKQFPDKFPGNPDSPASTLRSNLTAALQEHVYLAGITTNTALAGNDFKPSAATLDKNSLALSNAIGSVYGKAGGDQFLALWRKHIGFFVDYTTGKAKADDAMVTKARADLDGYRADFGAFLESATNSGLTKQAVADELKGHVESLEAAIDAQAAKDPKATDKLMTAASHMPMTADVLAGAITKQFPDKFTG